MATGWPAFEERGARGRGAASFRVAECRQAGAVGDEDQAADHAVGDDDEEPQAPVRHGARLIDAELGAEVEIPALAETDARKTDRGRRNQQPVEKQDGYWLVPACWSGREWV